MPFFGVYCIHNELYGIGCHAPTNKKTARSFLLGNFYSMTEEIPQASAEKQVITPHELVVDSVKELAGKRHINREQERVADTALRDAEFARIANRALFQGVDPELLRLTLPKEVEKIALALGLSKEDADKAIEIAHTMGPGSLSKDSPQEWLWLILAKHSHDEAQSPQKPAELLAETAEKLMAFRAYASGTPNPEADARAFREEILKKVQPIGIAPQGTDVPLYDSDLGFYAAYRGGKHIAATRDKNGLIFYGSDGSVELANAGIKTQKALSPYFGIDFPEEKT